MWNLISTIMIGMVAVVMLSGVALADPSAPVRRTVGPYEITARYAEDPPYLEEGNALLIEVRDTRTGQPVTGLEQTLQVQGSVVVLDVTKSYRVPLRRFLDQAGVYEGVFVPPSLGRYIFDVTGTIDGTPVNVQFTSGNGGLPDVTARSRGDYNDPGVYLAVAIAAAYVIGLVAILAVMAVRRLRRQHAL